MPRDFQRALMVSTPPSRGPTLSRVTWGFLPLGSWLISDLDPREWTGRQAMSSLRAVYDQKSVRIYILNQHRLGGTAWESGRPRGTTGYNRNGSGSGNGPHRRRGFRRLGYYSE